MTVFPFFICLCLTETYNHHQLMVDKRTGSILFAGTKGRPRNHTTMEEQPRDMLGKQAMFQSCWK